MPPQPMPATESTVQGAVCDLLLSDPALFVLVPPGSIFAAEAVPEAGLPFVVVHDRNQGLRPLTPAGAGIETHRITIEAYSKGAVAPGQQNPAEVITANIRRILPITVDLPIPGFVTVRVELTSRKLTEERKRAADKARVYKAELVYEIVIAN